MVVKGIYTLDGRVPLEMVVDVLCDINNREKWNSSMKDCHIIKIYSDNLTIFNYVVHMPYVKNRDFVEKRIVFRCGESIYMYYSSVEDKIFPKREECVRGYTIFSVSKIRREQSGLVVYFSNQQDFQASFDGMVPSTIGKKVVNVLEIFKKEINQRLESLLFG